MTGGAGSTGRTFLLRAGYLGGALAGAWLGLVAAAVSGMIASGPPRFPGEDLVAALAAAVAVAVVYIFIRRVDGQASARGLLFVAAFATLDLLCALYLLPPTEILCVVPPPEVEASAGPHVLLAAHHEVLPECRLPAPPLLSPKLAAAMVPAVVVTVLLCSAAVRRSALLQLAGLALGSMSALAGLVLALARAFG